METSLHKVLRLAAPDLLEPSALGGADQDVHDHLMHECSWYAQVCEGENATDPKGCKSAGTVSTERQDPPGLVVKMTPRTAEASTVPQPTVPPGGPGLFHHKGLELPPYVQHLYKHLVGRYGKHGAYKVAVGVVKKWAAGVNPGGFKTKSGKGKRTHPDVRAAAQRNVAMWEKDRTEGGNKHG